MLQSPVGRRVQGLARRNGGTLSDRAVAGGHLSIVGALVGDWLLHRLGLHFGAGIIGLVINATIGAIELLLALRLLGAGG